MTDFSKLSDGEINRLVAERLGAKCKCHDRDVMRRPDGQLIRLVGECVEPDGSINDAMHYEDHPASCHITTEVEIICPVHDSTIKFTTDPAAWWPLVDHLKRIHAVCIDATSGLERVTLIDYESLKVVHVLAGMSIGRMVCICFLKATEGGK